MMSQGDGLRLLEVGVARDDDIGVRLGYLDERPGELGQLLLAQGARLEQIEADVERDLVVAGPSGVELPADVSDLFDEATLDRRMHIFVGVEELERPIFGIGEQLVERHVDRRVLGAVDQADIRQHADVADRPADVYGQQPPIGLGGGVPPQHVRGRIVESAAPQCHLASLPPKR